MLKNRILFGITLTAVVMFGVQANLFAMGKKVKKQATFKVLIENISSADGQVTEGGAKYPFALSPGVFIVTERNSELFKLGKKARAGLKAQAEDGNPSILSNQLLTRVGSTFMGVFNKPVGSDMPAPILPGGSFEFTFQATEGMKLNLVSMFGQSNDLFYAPKQSIALFDANGNPLTGDITGDISLWDAGTEVNQAPGIGPDQAPRQKMAGQGTRENSIVGPVKDGFAYPNTSDVLRITIAVE